MKYISIIVVVCVLISCLDIPFYSEFKTVDPNGWNSADTLNFNLKIPDSSKRFDSYIDISHTGSYPFSNIYLFIDITYPNSKHRVDTLECVLADNRGSWYGSGLGDMVNHRVEYLNDIGLPLSGDYEVSITHGMRREPLEEITDLGLRFEIVNHSLQ